MAERMAKNQPNPQGIGGRIRELRNAKQMSQGDIEERSGLLRCYISRVENGHTVPSIETLERFASALDVPVFKFFRPLNEALQSDGPAPPEMFGSDVDLPKDEETRFIRRIRELLPHLTRRDQKVLLELAKKMAEK